MWDFTKYAYLILSSQASARSGIVGNTASALTAQSAFLNNFEDIVNQRVDVRGDIKHYQDTLSYASSKVNYSMGENIYMLPSNMKLKIKTGTVGYNNEILISDGNFNLAKNDEVNASLAKSEEEASGPRYAKTTTKQKMTTVHKVVMNAPQLLTAERGASTSGAQPAEKTIITHEEEKAALILFITGGFNI